MIWSLAVPSDLALAAFRLKQRRRAFTYPDPGCTRDGGTVRHPRFRTDRLRVRLGDGPDVFAAARDALLSWRQIPAGWVVLDPPAPPVAAGTVVSISARPFGVGWLTIADRVVYVIDEPARFGYAYGTLPAHVERGEERFLVEQRADGAVWYDLLVSAEVSHWLARLGYPFARYAQRRFWRESAAAMRAAVGELAAVPAAG